MEKKSPSKNEAEITEIKKLTEKIVLEQTNIIKVIQNNHKITMRKIGKLQEYNEIDDMVNQVFEARISKIEEVLQDINSKIA